MKKLIILTLLSISALILAPLAQAANEGATDLLKLKEAGLSEETLSRFLAQNLSDRAAPQIDPKFLARVGQYGGDHLARTYLELDKLSSREKNPKFSQNSVDRMIKAQTPPAEIQMILGEEIARYESENKRASAQPLMPPSLPPSASAEADAAVGAGFSAPSPAASASQLQAAPETSVARLNKPVDPQIMVSPRLPEAAPRPAGYQDLRPGQAADPASRQPLPYSTYDIRSNRQAGDLRRHNPDGPWMGVVEKELPDGHVVEAHSIGYGRQVGQEVYSRPSGHKVYRYFTGNPDAPHSGADPRQEAINRDQLNIIYQSRPAGY